MSRPRLTVLADDFSIHRLPADSPLPAAVVRSPFVWTGRTEAELSIVCPSHVAVSAERTSPGWAALRAAGPIDFNTVGVLAGIASVLAAAGVSLFALSTFDTDTILVSATRLGDARRALVDAGYDLVFDAEN